MDSFSRFMGFGKKKESSENESSPNSHGSSALNTEGNEHFEVNQSRSTVNLIGCGNETGKGWPSDVSTVLYHRNNLLYLGTSSGKLIVYGSGFQLMFHIHVELENLEHAPACEINCIKSVHQDKILLQFVDSSFMLLNTDTMNTIAVMTRNELFQMTSTSTSRASELCISSVYVDEASLKGYAYVGLSNGHLLVLNFEDGGLFVCDYHVSAAEVGLDGALISIEICPKDEKYIALSYDSGLSSSSQVLIYDLSKKKVKQRHMNINANSITWDNTGEFLFVSDLSRGIHLMELENQSSHLAWNLNTADDEFAEGNEDEDEDMEENNQSNGQVNKVVIKSIKFLAPQNGESDTESGSEGCLFILLEALDKQMLENNLVVLELKKSKLGEILVIPSVVGEEIIDFTFVPCESPSQPDKGVCASLLLITQMINLLDDSPTVLDNMRMSGFIGNDGNKRGRRQLRLLNTPESKPAEWILETGMLPEPRKLSELLPRSEAITTLFGVHVGPTDSSALTAVRSKFEEGGELCDYPALVEGSSNDWTLILAPISPVSKPLHITEFVFMGYSDGVVLGYGVCTPSLNENDDSLTGALWAPIFVFPADHSTSKITCITYEEKNDLLVSGNVDGGVTLWKVGSADDLEDTTMLLDMQLSESICITRVIAIPFADNDGLPGATILVGTKTGQLFYCIYKTSGLQGGGMLLELDTSNAKPVGSILELSNNGPLYKGEAAIYAVLSSGQVQVLHMDMTTELLHLVSYSANPLLMKGAISETVMDEVAWERDNSVDESNVFVVGGHSNNVDGDISNGDGGDKSSKSSNLDAGEMDNYDSQILLVMHGRSLVKYNISSFTAHQESSMSMSMSMGLTSPKSDGFIKRRVSMSKIVSAQSVGIDLIAFTNASGSTGLFSSKDSKPLISFMNLLDSENMTDPITSQAATTIMSPPSISKQGDGDEDEEKDVEGEGKFTIFVHNDENLVSAARSGGLSHTEGLEEDISAPMQDPQSFRFRGPTILDQNLKTGREAKIAKIAKKIEKRRSSIINFSSGPTDLSLLFAKPRDESTPPCFTVHVHTTTSSGSASPSTDMAKDKSNSAMLSMMEARQNLEERGEKLEQLAEKGDKFMNDSSDFKATAQQQRQELEKKSSFWGL